MAKILFYNLRIPLVSFFLISFVLLNFSFKSYSQSGVAINTTGANADSSAILDVASINQGLLLPRMTTTERNNISSPAQSLLIFNTTTLCLEIYINNIWQSIYCTCNLPSSPIEGTHVPAKNQIEWNWNSTAGSIGYKYNTSNNYQTAIDIGNNTSFIQTNLNCESTYTLYVWSYNSCGNSTSYTEMTATTSSCWSCGDNLVVAHTAGIVAPVNKTVTYGTVSTNLSGSTKCWITQNLGATNQATSPTDATEDAGGWFWQFNCKQGYKHDGSTRTPSSWYITNINENSNWEPANDPCTILLGSTWRIPTYSEWYNADANNNWSNFNQTFSSAIKLHAAGLLYPNDGSLYGRGAAGYYFTSSQYSTTQAYHLGLGSTGSSLSEVNKPYGMTLRCIKD